MSYTRRQAMKIGAGALAVLATSGSALAAALEDAIAAFTGGAATGTGDITIKAPEIAENGNVVPVEVIAPGAVEIVLLAPGNPSPGVAQAKFGPLAATQRVSTRMRLAKTQDVTAVAKMADGSFITTSQTVKVTVGGCGG